MREQTDFIGDIPLDEEVEESELCCCGSIVSVEERLDARIEIARIKVKQRRAEFE